MKGLRKIVDRSRAKALGGKTRGPTIRFFQTTKGAPVKFKQEWLEEFVQQHTVNPDNELPQRKQRKRLHEEQPAFGFDADLLDV